MRSFIALLFTVLTLAFAAPAHAQATCGSEGLVTIYYETGKTAVTAEHKGVLDKFASVAKFRNRTCVLAQVDAQGSDDVNKRVAKARADAVVDYLVSVGVKRDTIVVAEEGKSFTLFGLLKTDRPRERSVTLSYK